MFLIWRFFPNPTTNLNRHKSIYYRIRSNIFLENIHIIYWYKLHDTKEDETWHMRQSRYIHTQGKSRYKCRHWWSSVQLAAAGPVSPLKVGIVRVQSSPVRHARPEPVGQPLLGHHLQLVVAVGVPHGTGELLVRHLGVVALASIVYSLKLASSYVGLKHDTASFMVVRSVFPKSENDNLQQTFIYL